MDNRNNPPYFIRMLQPRQYAVSLTQRTDNAHQLMGSSSERLLLSFCVSVVWDKLLFYIKSSEKFTSHYHPFPHPSVRLDPAKEWKRADEQRVGGSSGHGENTKHPRITTGQDLGKATAEQQPPVLTSPDCTNHGTQIFISPCFILNTLQNLQHTETPSLAEHRGEGSTFL